MAIAALGRGSGIAPGRGPAPPVVRPIAVTLLPTPGPLHKSRLADRIKQLIGAAALEDLAAVATELSVDERELRRLIERRTRVWSVDVLAALVLRYGIDPNWLVTGVYDERAHHEALERADEGIASM